MVPPPGGDGTWSDAAARRHSARPAILGEPHVVVGALERAGRAAVVLVAELLRQMLAQRAPAGDVQKLHPAADSEDGQIAGRALRARARSRTGRAPGRCRRSSSCSLGVVDTRVDVGAAREQQPRRSVSRASSGCSATAGIGGQEDGEAAGAVRSINVLLRQQRRGVVPHAPPCALPGRAHADHRSIHDGSLYVDIVRPLSRPASSRAVAGDRGRGRARRRSAATGCGGRARHHRADHRPRCGLPARRALRGHPAR